MLARPSLLVRTVIGCAIRVHRTLGPGLHEVPYQTCLAEELTIERIVFEREVPVPVVYEGRSLGIGYRVDFVVSGCLVLEIKCVERLIAVHQAQMVTYLRLLNLHHGLLMNFKAPRLIDGLRSVVR